MVDETASRTVLYYDNFGVDVQDETAKRTHAEDGTPLEEPQDVPLRVVVFTHHDPMTGNLLERRFRLLPETAAKLKDALDGSSIVKATPGDLITLEAAAHA